MINVRGPERRNCILGLKHECSTQKGLSCLKLTKANLGSQNLNTKPQRKKKTPTNLIQTKKIEREL